MSDIYTYVSEVIIRDRIAVPFSLFQTRAIAAERREKQYRLRRAGLAA